MDKIKTDANQLISQVFITEVYTWVSDIISGLIIMFAFFVINNESLSQVLNTDLVNNLNIYITILATIFLYIIGITNSLFVDTIFQSIEKVGLYLRNKNSKNFPLINSISNILIRFSSIPGPLTTISKEYSPQYKNMLINELNKVFKINGTSNELTDLSKKFIALEDRAAPSKYYYLFSIYKGMLTSSLIIMMFSIFEGYYLSSSIFFILSYGCYIRIRNITINSLKSSVERSYLLILEKVRIQKNNLHNNSHTD